MLFSPEKAAVDDRGIGFPKALMAYSIYDTVFVSCILPFFNYWKSKNSQNILIHCGLSYPPGNQFEATMQYKKKKRKLGEESVNIGAIFRQNRHLKLCIFRIGIKKVNAISF